MSTGMSLGTEREQQKILGSAEIRRMLTDFVRRRVPESDVEDIVQTVLVEALASDRVPAEKSELRKWLTGVARHKIADHHRRAGRERPEELADIETGPPPVEERELADWAEKQAKSSKEGAATLRWMAREGEGDKLEHIAAEEKLPAATVRQRVSRMRRWMKERWLAEIAAAAAVLGLALFIIYRFVVNKPDEIAKDPPLPPGTQTTEPGPKPIAPSPLQRAQELRRAAIGDCASRPTECLKALDEAKELDPAGDAAPEVQGARRAAEKTLNDQIDQRMNELQKNKSPDSSSTALPIQQPSPKATPTGTPSSVPPAPTTTTAPTPKAPAPKKETTFGSEKEFDSKPQSSPPTSTGSKGGKPMAKSVK